MGRMLCVFLCAGVVLTGFLFGPALAAQEPSVIGGDKAVRFEQSPGYFHYAAVCRTLKESTQQVPAPNLPPEITEPAVCWYVKTLVMGGPGTSPEADGKLVISAHHVRFVPRSMQFADLYVDLPPDQVQFAHQPGQRDALLAGGGISLRFRFNDICPACDSGTVNTPVLVPALLDREFTLLSAGIRQFDSGWKQIDGLIEPQQADSPKPPQPDRAAATTDPTPAVPQPPPVAATTPSTPAVFHPAPPPAPATPAPAPPVVAEIPPAASHSSPKPEAATAPAPTPDQPHGGGQPARLGGAQALRFEQSPGFFHYIAFCRTAKDTAPQMPPTKLPPDSMEYALCWYVTGSVSRGSTVSPEMEGKLVISPHHVRFEPRDAGFAKLYVELPPEGAELRHDSAQNYAVLQGNDVVFRFQFTKMCPSCKPGTSAPPKVVPALMDEEFGLLDKTIRNFHSGWKEIYRLSSGPRPESDSKEPGGMANLDGSPRSPVDSAPGPTPPSRR